MAEEPRIPAAPAVSEQELDLTAVVPGEDRFLRMEILWREVTDDEEEPLGRVIAKTSERFPVRANLAIPTMTSLLRSEAEINRSLAEEDPDDANAGLEKALGLAHRRIVAVLTDRSPRAFSERQMEGQTVRGVVELDTSQILVTLAWIAGDISVADAVAKALTAGKSESKTPEQLAAEAEARGESADVQAGGEAAPLAS